MKRVMKMKVACEHLKAGGMYPPGFFGADLPDPTDAALTEYMNADYLIVYDCRFPAMAEYYDMIGACLQSSGYDQ